MLFFFFSLLTVACGDKENTGNGADDKKEEGPYQYTNEGTPDSAATQNH
ncbi:MAG: hypothetical protein K0R26_707 [Bacteroidota bacterium]|nr:hypothetical protein [Bacteroidota bacterium]